MTKFSVAMTLFAGFAFGLPIWAMQANQYTVKDNHDCSGECYERWQAETGGLLAMASEQAEARAKASPAELGELAYAGCIACHGARGEGGIGPQLSGQPATDVAAKLLQYKNGETRGPQSALMWGQAAQLSPADIDNLAAYIETL
jgi:cytochrome c553